MIRISKHQCVNPILWGLNSHIDAVWQRMEGWQLYRLRVDGRAGCTAVLLSNRYRCHRIDHAYPASLLRLLLQ